MALRILPPREAGFTYLWLLLALAVGAAGLAALAQRASVAVQRDREAELIARGNEIARALSSYRAATPGPAKEWPLALQDLLDDRRGLQPIHHLRRVYPDPFSGLPDWVLITTAEGRISGVHSRAQVPALRVFDLPPTPAGARAMVSSRKFNAALVATARPLPASAATSEAGHSDATSEVAPAPQE